MKVSTKEAILFHHLAMFGKDSLMHTPEELMELLGRKRSCGPFAYGNMRYLLTAGDEGLANAPQLYIDVADTLIGITEEQSKLMCNTIIFMLKGKWS